MKVTSEAARELVVRLAYGGKGRPGQAPSQGPGLGLGHNHHPSNLSTHHHPTDPSRSPLPTPALAPHPDLWATTLRADISLALGELKRKHYASYPHQFTHAQMHGLGLDPAHTAPAPGLGWEDEGVFDGATFQEHQDGSGAGSGSGLGPGLGSGLGSELGGAMRKGGSSMREGGRAASALARGLSNKISAFHAAKRAGVTGPAAGAGLGPGLGLAGVQGPGPRRRMSLRVDLDDFLFDDDGCYQLIAGGERYGCGCFLPLVNTLTSLVYTMNTCQFYYITPLVIQYQHIISLLI